jgi:hypothetical protein
MTKSSTLNGLAQSARASLAASTVNDVGLFNEEVQSLESERPDARLTQEEFDANLRACELKQINDIINARKAYAEKVFKLVVFWLIAVLVILIVQGLVQTIWEKSVLSDHVLMALIGGTTVNVIGIFTIVANFLFPKSGHSFFSRESVKKASKKKKISKLPAD